jgi:predicted nucleic acid-binding protein
VWSEIEPGSQVRSLARRLLRVHDLRAADALQLAAAVVGTEHHPALLPLVTLDRRLANAARLEGFPVVTPGAD